ncbi:MAG: methylmalonyl Co-A mutase-associated GTPase MeaB [Bacteroidota bacterium]
MAKHIHEKAEPDHIPASVNPHLKARKRKERSASYYIDGILSGDRVILSQAITLIESNRKQDQLKARSIVEACLPHSGRSFRLGITGVPGVGKSTFIETFGLQLLQKEHQLAVLTIDPSSQLTKGSILGDKTRMAQLSTHDKVFIRPSPAGDSLGGVAAKTREAVLLCEAAGYDFILIETVGVGQSEVAVYQLTDFFLLLLLPGAGDELQGIKRGVVEMADMIAVNKADHDRVLSAQKARAAYQRALHLYPPKSSGWTAQALTCSALQNEGISEIIDQLGLFLQRTKGNGHFLKNRQDQAVHWFRQQLQQRILDNFLSSDTQQKQLKKLEAAIIAGEVSPQAGVERFLSS